MHLLLSSGCLIKHEKTTHRVIVGLGLEFCTSYVRHYYLSKANWKSPTSWDWTSSVETRVSVNECNELMSLDWPPKKQICQTDCILFQWIVNYSSLKYTLHLASCDLNHLALILMIRQNLFVLNHTAVAMHKCQVPTGRKAFPNTKTFKGKKPR